MNSNGTNYRTYDVRRSVVREREMGGLQSCLARPLIMINRDRCDRWETGNGRRESVARASRRTGVLRGFYRDRERTFGRNARFRVGGKVDRELSFYIRITRSANNLGGELRGIISRARRRCGRFQYEGGIFSRLDDASRVESAERPTPRGSWSPYFREKARRSGNIAPPLDAPGRSGSFSKS